METPPSRGCKAVQSPWDARDAAYECRKATGGKALNTDAEEWRGKPSRAARRTSAGRRGASPDSCLTHHSSHRSPDSNGSCEHAGDDHLGMSPMQELEISFENKARLCEEEDRDAASLVPSGSSHQDGRWPPCTTRPPFVPAAPSTAQPIPQHPMTGIQHPGYAMGCAMPGMYLASPVAMYGSSPPQFPAAPPGMQPYVYYYPLSRLGMGSPHDGGVHMPVHSVAPATAPPAPRRATARIARSQRTGAPYDPALYDVFPGAVGADGRTTVMLRNIPNKYCQRYLLRHFASRGLDGEFDFVYLPIDFRSRCNLGYAFVNVLRPEAVAAFHAEYHGLQWEAASCTKVCTVSYARIQGREALITHFMDARFVVDDPSVMPIVYTGVHEQRAVQPTCMQDYLRSRGLVAPRGAQAATDPGGGRAKQHVLGA